jgi:hypothetical protein
MERAVGEPWNLGVWGWGSPSTGKKTGAGGRGDVGGGSGPPEAEVGEGGAARRSRERRRPRAAEAGGPAGGGGGGGAGLELIGGTSLLPLFQRVAALLHLLSFSLPFPQLPSYSTGRNFNRRDGHPSNSIARNQGSSNSTRM